ncbi:hypothetical protein AYI69_g6304 [Smittium culicis]|uniref:Uncharacterized protein n=1 Tax=Smittium culicis TaxID=133412 RepID=A0A1R1Y041_9FUNG|nr:hypothetical protein AYI69_g6304 [Smittium culicis]
MTNVKVVFRERIDPPGYSKIGFLEKDAGSSFPSMFVCSSTAPTAYPEASVLRIKGRLKSGCFNDGSFKRISVTDLDAS